MADLASSLERRCGARVTMRGMAVFYGEDGATRGTIENVSRGGALIRVVGPNRNIAEAGAIDVELELGHDSGWARARAVRVRRFGTRVWQIAVAFDHVDATLSDAIDGAIVSARRRRPTAARAAAPR